MVFGGSGTIIIDTCSVTSVTMFAPLYDDIVNLFVFHYDIIVDLFVFLYYATTSMFAYACKHIGRLIFGRKRRLLTRHDFDGISPHILSVIASYFRPLFILTKIDENGVCHGTAYGDSTTLTKLLFAKVRGRPFLLYRCVSIFVSMYDYERSSQKKIRAIYRKVPIDMYAVLMDFERGLESMKAPIVHSLACVLERKKARRPMLQFHFHHAIGDVSPHDYQILMSSEYVSMVILHTERCPAPSCGCCAKILTAQEARPGCTFIEGPLDESMVFIADKKKSAVMCRLRGKDSDTPFFLHTESPHKKWIPREFRYDSKWFSTEYKKLCKLPVHKLILVDPFISNDAYDGSVITGAKIVQFMLTHELEEGCFPLARLVGLDHLPPKYIDRPNLSVWIVRLCCV